MNKIKIITSDTFVTESTVISGLKFIAENRLATQDDLAKGLFDLGCTFTIGELNKQFPDEPKIYEGVHHGNIITAAYIICNVRDSQFGRSYIDEKFLSIDDDYSIYHMVRLLTDDPSYTEENIKAAQACS